ncbi:MAG: putative inner membrane protein [Candidatus Methanofastidiosum methylothiophilum]|jgi:predicted PurR-regulated permease PerM|uniref:Putative inner membrane protein n=1 Tax=Candidatus Methanofastidiosum methylothiophilum TaxID=1705564 RepID=A0A150J8G4_9EURY|nr:MAG: putative inner membrane protein [Candidatus Methanofastidiosum methylthiophilus]
MDRISYIKFTISAIIVLMGVYLVYPMLPGIIGGFVFAYAFLPVYNILFKKTNRKGLSAALTTLFISAPILLVVLYVLFKALTELRLVTEILSSSSVFSIFSLFGINITQSPFYSFITQNFPQIINLSQMFNRTMSRLPLTVLNMVILFLALYYFLHERESIEDFFRKIMPSSYYKDLLEILEPTKKVINGLIYGNVMSAMITGLLATIGFIALGIPYSFLLGLFVGFAALLPVTGPWTVFIPVGVFYLLIGDLFRGFALLIYGVAFLGILYNFYIFPKLGGNQAHLHPFIVLVGFLGGAYMMGPVGLLYGPIILGLLKGLTESIVKETSLKRRFFRL